MVEKMAIKIFVRTQAMPHLKEPIAIVGSPGLRSIGITTTNYLTKELNAIPFAEIYASNLPIIYSTKPSYATIPRFSGIAGGKVRKGKLRLPTVRFYFKDKPEHVKDKKGQQRLGT